MKPESEMSLDPLDWEAFRKHAHKMLDDVITYVQTVENRPVWTPTTEELRKNFQLPLPLKGEGPDKVYDDFVQSVLYHPLGNIHPRFWGWVNGTGSAQGAMAELLIAAVNNNVSTFDQAALYAELQVLDWLKQIMNYPGEASGIFVTGGSVANLVGLAVARTAAADWDVTKKGLQGNQARLCSYGSNQTHFSVEKGLQVLGLGSESFRKINVNEKYQIDVQHLKEAIARDRQEGNRPCCIIGNAGTVNTGALDPLDELAELCTKENLWFHVDGAFGALAALSTELRPLLRGMERSDSLAFDLHKWLYMPYDIGCILVRHPELHQKTFAGGGAYTSAMTRGLSATSTSFRDLGLEQSRSARGLKAWLLLKEHGLDTYCQLIEQNVHQAKYLASLIQQHSELELCAPVSLNIVCFRYLHPSSDEDNHNKLNKELIGLLQESGIAVPSYTILDGRFVIRAAITNHRSRRKDFDLLVNSVIDLGRKLTA